MSLETQELEDKMSELSLASKVRVAQLNIFKNQGEYSARLDHCTVTVIPVEEL